MEWKCSERTEKGDVEKDAEWIHRTMIEAADVSMQRASKRADNKKQVYWWNDDITEVRSKCIQDRRKWSRAKTKKKKAERKHGEHAEEAKANLHCLERCYKNSQKNVVKAIYKAKEAAWKELISEIDRDQWGTPYKVIMNKLRPAGPGLMEILENEELEKLIYKLFPRETKRTKTGTVKIGIWKEEWNISTTELCNVIARKRRNTAPGPDGITMRMWRKIPGKMIEKLTEMINNML